MTLGHTDPSLFSPKDTTYTKHFLAFTGIKVNFSSCLIKMGTVWGRQPEVF